MYLESGFPETTRDRLKSLGHQLAQDPGGFGGYQGETVAASIKQRLQFQAEVVLVPVGTLPRFEMKSKRLVREA